MNTIANPCIQTRAENRQQPARSLFTGALTSLTADEQAVLLTCRHLVRHKYRELIEWCQRVKTDYIEVMVTTTDIKLFHDSLTPQSFVAGACKLKDKASRLQVMFPILDVCLVAAMPELLSVTFSWEVFSWLTE